MSKAKKILRRKIALNRSVNIRLSQEKRITRNTIRLLKQERNEARKSYSLTRKKYKFSKRNSQIKQSLKSKIRLQRSSSISDNPKLFKKNNRYSLENSKLESDLTFKKDKAIIANKAYKKAKKIKNSVGMRGFVRRNIKQNLRTEIQKTTNKEDTLAEWNKLKQQANTRTNMYYALTGTAKNSSKVTYKVVKNTYGLAKRSLKLIKGKRFVKTKTNKSLFKNQRKKLRRFRQRLAHKKAFKATKFASKLVGKVVSYFNNFFKTKNIVLTLAVLFILSLFLGQIFFKGRPAIIQHEKELTEAYTRFTYLDAKNSTTKNVFNTDWHDAMFYFNYRYGEFKTNGSTLTDELTGEELSDSFYTLSEKLWKDMNGEKDNYHFKPLTALSSDSSSYWYMEKNDNESWQEMKREIGYESLEDLLESPFGKGTSVVINKRYGYYRRGDVIALRNQIEISASSHSIYSPLTATVTYAGLGGVGLEVNGRASLYIGGVDASSLHIGDQIPVGTYLGTAKRSYIELDYKKYDNELGWYYVNPEFYFPKVEYKQFTSLASKRFKPKTEILNKAKFIKDFLLQEGFSLEGIAAILGNFAVESNINPKRAEGDYLPPPIGATESSWDNDSWLDIGGMEIYGKYPNIVHRGLGLGQWTDTLDGSVRQTKLREYAKQKGMNWYDLELQLDFMVNGDIPSARNILRKVGNREFGSSVAELTEAFLNHWEGNPNDKLASRIQSATDWYNYFTVKTVAVNGNAKDVYEAYKDTFFAPITETETRTGYEGNAYALGNCTWYVYNRMKQFGKSIYPYMGNADQWARNYHLTSGASLVESPSVGDIATFNGGVYGSSPLYGHVGFVEAVLEDGSFVMSEMNVQGEYTMGYRILKPTQGVNFIHVD